MSRINITAARINTRRKSPMMKAYSSSMRSAVAWLRLGFAAVAGLGDDSPSTGSIVSTGCGLVATDCLVAGLDRLRLDFLAIIFLE
jgi:hypothetical protein